MEHPRTIRPDHQHQVVNEWHEWSTSDLPDVIEIAVNRLGEKGCTHFVIRTSRFAVWVGGWLKKPVLPDVPDLGAVDLTE